ncbi:MAG: hypothetical protein QXH34_05310 [Ignisphaera sp.]
MLGADEVLIKHISMNYVKFIAKRPKDSGLDTVKARVRGLSILLVTECLTRFTSVYKREDDLKTLFKSFKRLNILDVVLIGYESFMMAAVSFQSYTRKQIS